MANHLAIDSGGTKVLGILYDDDFTPKAISRVGSFRTNTTSPELVRHNMEQMRRELGLIPGTVIDSGSKLYPLTYARGYLFPYTVVK